MGIKDKCIMVITDDVINCNKRQLLSCARHLHMHYSLYLTSVRSVTVRNFKGSWFIKERKEQMTLLIQESRTKLAKPKQTKLSSNQSLHQK